ncbi:MAG: hypothetical protein KFB93_03965 [Simkaniaceae bacterium]|nr:MAG: hypothetical protein KFB93_03965 [Simkaniaceae bacterium]
MFAYASSYFNLDPRWQVLTTTGPEYQVEREAVSGHLGSPARAPVPRMSQEVSKTLDAVKSVIDLTHTFSSNTTKSLVYFTAFNVLCYHFTGWISGVALMYGITIVVFGWISHDFSKLEAESLRLREIFVLINGPIDDPILRSEETPSLLIRDGRLRIEMTLVQVRNAIREIDRLRGSLPILNYYAVPLRTPLQNISINLGKIETHLQEQLQG